MAAMRGNIAFCSTVFLLVGFISEIGAQNSEYWSSTSAPRYRQVNKVAISENLDFFAVGGNESNDAISSVMLSEDTCENWYIPLDVVNPWLKDVSFPGSQYGYTVGDEGMMYKSTDKGRNWMALTTSGITASRDFNAVHFFDEENGIAAGGIEANDSILTIVKTGNGGDTWSVILDRPDPWINDIYFVDTNLGFAVGDFGTILKTNDGGDNWMDLTAPAVCAQRKLNAVHFLSDKIGVIVGGNPVNDSIETIIRTEDGGSTWTIISDKVAPMLNSVHFYTPSEGYAVGDWGVIYFTNDKGENWTELDVEVNDDLHLKDIYFISSKLGVAGGSNGKILYYIDLSGSTPDVTIDSIAKIKDSESVIISGVVNPNNDPTLVEFEYGMDGTFNMSVEVSTEYFYGITPHELTLTLEGLQNNTGYQGRFKATNLYGETYSESIMFYTSLSVIPNFNFEDWEHIVSHTIHEWNTLGEVSRVSSYNGSYAAQINSRSGSPGLLLIGEVVPDKVIGGLPFTSRPDSLALWCDYDISNNDTAVILLQLKSEGEAIADTVYKISGNSGGYEYLKYDIGYRSSEAPDSLLLVISNTNVTSTTFDPESVLRLDDISLISSAETLPNNDMEDWTEVNRYKAVGWSSADDFYPEFPFFADRSTDAYAGDYALKLSNKDDGRDVIFGTIETGDSIEKDIPVFPLNFRHEKCYGFYKFFPAEKDTLHIFMNFYKDGQLIGFSNAFIAEAAYEYQMFVSEISYDDEEEVPDSASISISIGNISYTENSADSYALIDNITFDGVMALEEEIQNIHYREEVNMKVYPNPFSNRIFIEISEENQHTNYDILIVDLLGRVHLHKRMADMNYTNRTDLDVSMLPAQFYILLVKAGNNLYSRKIIKQ